MTLGWCCCYGDYGDCTLTIHLSLCGFNVGAGYVVDLLDISGDLLDEQTTDSTGTVTFPIVYGTGTYQVRITPPMSSPAFGLFIPSQLIVCPGDSDVYGQLQPSYGEGCTNCGPVPVPSNLSLGGFPGATLDPTTTNGFSWAVNVPVPDCPDKGCPFTDPGGGAPTTTVVEFVMTCLSDGTFRLTMQWLARYPSPYGSPAHGAPGYSVGHNCVIPWRIGSELPFGVDNYYELAVVQFVSNLVATSGAFFVEFSPTPLLSPAFVDPTDPFLTLLCNTGSFTPTVFAT